MPHQLDRWMYKGGRPNEVAKLLNGIWRLVGLTGLPPHRLNTLEVAGRRSGKLRSFPVVVADYEGQRYLVAMLGERVNWVANVRAAGGQAVLRHGTREPVQLCEVAPGSRAPILQRYLQLAPGARAHVQVDPSAPLAEFEAVAARYPVFRVSPATTAVEGPGAAQGAATG
ncbi:MAG: nitroreductase/quinone reductase family protein [Solirubrobacteraceae bacterium]